MARYEDGNVGIGSTVPPDVARYRKLASAQASGNVGIGSTVPPDDGNVGDGNVGDGNVGDGNVGFGTV